MRRLLIALCAGLFLQGAGNRVLAAQKISPVVTEEEVTLTIPGLTRAHRILWVSDLHITTYPGDTDVSREHEQDVKERAELYAGQDGITPAEWWLSLCDTLEESDAEALILGGDMIDYASGENLSRLQAGIEKLKLPWMYLRADHDYGRWYGDMSLKEMRRLQRAVAPQQAVWVLDLEEFLLVGLDNTTSALTEEAVLELEQVCEQGRPVILCLHVPIDQLSEEYYPEVELPGDGELAKASGQGWEGRVLCWGEGDAYDTAKSTAMQQLVELIARSDSPVAAVLAGHLHFSWDGWITPSVREHVFSPAFAGTMGVITVAP